MGAEFEGRGLRQLAADFDWAADIAPADSRKVVAKGALNIKTDARRRVSGHAHLPRYPNSITYDSYETKTAAWAEVGPDKQKPQGPLGNIIEYGGLRGAPLPHVGPAADREAPRFEQAMADLAERAIRR